jgi:hypothetical protein
MSLIVARVENTAFIDLDFIDLYELLVVVLVVALALGAIYPMTSVLMFKARFSGALMNLLPQRLESVEQFALTGAWLESGSELRQIKSGAEGQADELEKALRATPGAKSSPKKQPEGRLIGGSDNVLKGGGASSRYGIVDGSIVVLGKMRGYEHPFQLTIRPAVPQGAEPATIIWLCGERGTPPGWIAARPHVPSSLPLAYLYSQCRKGPNP